MIVSRILCWSWAGLSLHPWREHIIQLSLRSLTTLSSSSSFHQHHHHDHYHHIIITIIIITRITVDQPHNLGGPSNPQQQSHLVCYSPRQHCPPLKLNLFVFSTNSIHFHLPIIVCLSVCLFVCLSVCVLTKCKPFQFAIHRQPSSFNICTASTAPAKDSVDQEQEKWFCKVIADQVHKVNEYVQFAVLTPPKRRFSVFSKPCLESFLPKREKRFLQKSPWRFCGSGGKVGPAGCEFQKWQIWTQTHKQIKI